MISAVADATRGIYPIHNVGFTHGYIDAAAHAAKRKAQTDGQVVRVRRPDARECKPRREAIAFNRARVQGVAILTR